MSTLDARPQLIPFDGSIRGEPCICGSSECNLISSYFRSIGDARGSKLTLPTLGGKRNAEVKRFKLQRICHHLGLGQDNYEQYGSFDTRDRTIEGSQAKRLKLPDSVEDVLPAHSIGDDELLANYVEEELNESKGKGKAQRKRQFIAIHHFHPEVIVNHLFVDNKIQFKDYLPDSFVREAGLWQNGYTEDDYFPGVVRIHKKNDGGVFVPVPTYKGAMEDYWSLGPIFQIKDLVNECKLATTPLEKEMPKLSADNPDDLKLAVCVMADEIEKLRLEKKQLQEQLKEEQKRNYSATLIKIASGNLDVPDAP